MLKRDLIERTFRSVAPLFLTLLVVGCASTARHWAEATSANTITAYADFVQRHPKSEYVAEARRRQEVIYTERNWATARKDDDIQAYEQFLKSRPNSQYAPQAKQRLEILRGERDWAVASSADDIKAYEAFLRQHPEATVAPEAQRRLRELRYASAREQWSFTAFEAFLVRYPQGADADTLRADLPAVKALEKSVALGHAIMEHAPHTRTRMTMSNSGVKVETTKRSDPTADDLERLRAMLSEGADPNAIRVAGFEPPGVKELLGARDVFIRSTGEPGRVVRAEVGGMTLLEYCRANALKSIAALLAEYGAK